MSEIFQNISDIFSIICLVFSISCGKFFSMCKKKIFVRLSVRSKVFFNRFFSEAIPCLIGLVLKYLIDNSFYRRGDSAIGLDNGGNVARMIFVAKKAASSLYCKEYFHIFAFVLIIHK